MELSLVKIAEIVVGVKSAKTFKTHSMNHISCKEYLNTLNKV